MQLKRENKTRTQLCQSAYTFAEVMVAVAVIAVMVVSLYLGISGSFSVIQRAREDLRATQILVQRAETVRLYNWDQLRYTGNPGWFQTNFTDIYDPFAGGTNAAGGGVTYHGNIRVTVPPPMLGAVSYRNDVALISISLMWTNHSGTRPFPHQRQFQTLVAKSGMQKYVYGNQ